MPHEWEHFQDSRKPNEFSPTGQVMEPERFAVLDDFDEPGFLCDELSREQCAALLPFMAEFAAGRDVWRYQPQTRHGKPLHVWRKLDFFDRAANPKCLALTFREDNPFDTQP